MRNLIIIMCFVFNINLFATIINVPSEQPTIQAGINVAVHGDTVLVQPGTYFELINYNGKNIKVASFYLTTQDTSYISQTIIDGNNGERLVSFTNGETEEAKLIGLTIRNGYGTYSNQQEACGVGIYILNSSPSIENNIIEDNDSYWYVNGCGIGLQNSSANIRNNIIRNNNGAYEGGGIYVYQSEDVVIENNIIYDHYAVSGNGVDYGAGICLNQSNNIMIKKNLIYDNIVGFSGSGIAVKGSSGFIYGNTIFNNSSSEYGNNIFIDNYSTAEIKNSILWSDDTNFGVEIANQGTVNVSYSNIRNSYIGVGNISRNPLFEDMIDRDFRLTLQSPCINSGDPVSVYDPDETIADMGYCYFDMSDYGSITGLVTLEPGIGSIENVIVTIDSFIISPFSNGDYIFNLLPGYYDVTASLGLHYEQTINNVQVIQNEVTTGIDFYLENTNTNIVIEINQDGTGDFTAIQEGINAAINGDTILVHSGIYFENINILEKSVILGSRFLITNDSIYISETIIDGSNYDSTISIENVEDTTCVINGFTIRNGNAIINGGGIYCYYSSPQILNCNITANNSDFRGGGIYLENSSTIIENSKIYNNSTYGGGGGIGCYFSNAIIKNNKIYNNTTDCEGGGISFYYSKPILEHCHITNNLASHGGGVSMVFNDSDFSLINNVFDNNQAQNGGALYYNAESHGEIINNLVYNNNALIGGGFYINTSYGNVGWPEFINCTIINNYAESNGGGIYFQFRTNSTFTNSIFWENEANIGSQVCIGSNSSNPNFNYSDIEDGFNGFGFTGNASIEDYDGEYENNIFLDPLFMEPVTNNFHLLQNSPCINAGIPDTTGLNLPEYDLDGESRIYDGIIDMGCYEWQGTQINDEELAIMNWKLSNYPNPFNPSTTISFELNTETTDDTELVIYNLKGKKVKDLSPSLCHPEFIEGRGENTFSVSWNGTDQNNQQVASGIYFYQLRSGDIEVSKKMLLLK